MVSINGDEVTQEDVDNVIHTARSIPISDDRRVLHVLPQEYSIDWQESIKSPIGMSGMRLEAKAHIITCASDMARNIEKCVERADKKIDGLVFSALASAHAVLTDDERELGVCLVDMGGGTIDIAIYTQGAVRYTAVIPVAGNQVTSDIATIFRTPLGHAEEIKVQHACALRQMVGQDDSIEVPSVGGRPARSMSRHTLAEVVEPRYQELFELVQDVLNRSGLEERQMAAGIVLTGGTAKMEGAVEFAENIFSLPVRLGAPVQVKGLADLVNDPSLATAVGLLHYGKEDLLGYHADQDQSGLSAENLWDRFKSWFKGEF
jgi:cell division protein FtsA